MTTSLVLAAAIATLPLALAPSPPHFRPSVPLWRPSSELRDAVLRRAIGWTAVTPDRPIHRTPLPAMGRHRVRAASPSGGGGGG